MKMKLLWSLVLGASLVATPGLAYPPTPQQVIYGCVRDQYGRPLDTTDSQVVLVTSTGVQLQTGITPGLANGINFALPVPMDAGLAHDLYQPTALKVAVPFKLYVVVDQVTNLPIQMTGNFVNLGQPGKQTRLDLTLGVDSNGDGIPDDWELAVLAALGLNLDLSTLNANMDLLGDGRTLRDEFLLGNILANPTNAFTLQIVDPNAGSPILQFVTMTAHSYAVVGSADLKTWTTISFVIPSEGTGLLHNFYYAGGIGPVQLQVVQPASGPQMNFFRMVAQ